MFTWTSFHKVYSPRKACYWSPICHVYMTPYTSIVKCYHYDEYNMFNALSIWKSILFSLIYMMYPNVPKRLPLLTLHLKGFFHKVYSPRKHVTDSPFTIYIPLYSYREALSLSMSISFSWVDMICLNVPKPLTLLTLHLKCIPGVPFVKFTLLERHVTDRPFTMYTFAPLTL